MCILDSSLGMWGSDYKYYEKQVSLLLMNESINLLELHATFTNA